MADSTTRYGFPYQEATDPPDGAALGQDLAEAVEASLGDLEDRGYLYLQQVRFTSSGTFTKASYPDARLARVRVQAAGGGGGGCQTNPAGQVSAGAGGEGGSYAESWLDVSSMSSSVTVTVGAGGTAGTTTGTGTAGDGGNSSFGTDVVAEGGAGGTNGGTGATVFIVQGGRHPSSANVGDIIIEGEPGESGVRPGGTFVSGQQAGGRGGSSFMGSGGWNGINNTGSNGRKYGGGGGGPSSAASTSGRNGTTGAAGIVIVDLYA